MLVHVIKCRGITELAPEVHREGRCLKRKRRRCPQGEGTPLLGGEPQLSTTAGRGFVCLPGWAAMTRRTGPHRTGMSTGMGVQLLQKGGYSGADTPGSLYHSGSLRPEDTSAAGLHMPRDVRLLSRGSSSHPSVLM